MKTMKTIFCLLLIFTLNSCSLTQRDGEQDDTIKLSTSKLMFESHDKVKEVTTVGEQWVMYLITNEDKSDGLDYSVDDLKVTNGNIGRFDKTPIKIESDWFIITRELQKIKVEVKENTTGKRRVVKIGVNDRNRFDRVIVEQM